MKKLKKVAKILGCDVVTAQVLSITTTFAEHFEMNSAGLPQSSKTLSKQLYLCINSCPIEAGVLNETKSISNFSRKMFLILSISSLETSLKLNHWLDLR